MGTAQKRKRCLGSSANPSQVFHVSQFILVVHMNHGTGRFVGRGTRRHVGVNNASESCPVYFFHCLQGVDFHLPPFTRHSLVFNDVSHRHTGAVYPIHPPSDVNCIGFGPPLCAGHVFLNLCLFKAFDPNCLSFGQRPPLGTQLWH